MESLFKKMGFTIIAFLITSMMLNAYIDLFGQVGKSSIFDFVAHVMDGTLNTEYDVPDVKENDFFVSSGILEVGETFNWKNYVTVKSTNNLDLIEYIVMEGFVDTSIVGEYDVVYSLTWKGRTILKTAKYYVTEKLIDPMYLIQYDTYFEHDGVLIEGEMPSNAVSLYYESDDYVGLTAPSASGLNFIGWYDNPDFNGDMITGIDADETGDKLFYAYYSLIRYNIDYVLDGGMLPDDAKSFYYVTDKSYTLPLPTKDGYIFDGWYSNSSFTGEKIETLPAGSVDNITYYAKWKPAE